MDSLISLKPSNTKKMSIYIVKHRNKYHRYYLRDEYHHTLIRFWRDSRNLDTIEIPDSLKKGIKHNDIIDPTDFDTVYNVAEKYQSQVCTFSDSLWWYLNTETMRIGLIPQD